MVIFRRILKAGAWQISDERDVNTIRRYTRRSPRFFVIVASGCEFVDGHIVCILRPTFDANRHAFVEQLVSVPHCEQLAMI
jgi:hypothetical protein